MNMRRFFAGLCLCVMLVCFFLPVTVYADQGQGPGWVLVRIESDESKDESYPDNAATELITYEPGCTTHMTTTYIPETLDMPTGEGSYAKHEPNFSRHERVTWSELPAFISLTDGRGIDIAFTYDVSLTVPDWDASRYELNAAVEISTYIEIADKNNADGGIGGWLGSADIMLSDAAPQGVITIEPAHYASQQAGMSLWDIIDEAAREEPGFAFGGATMEVYVYTALGGDSEADQVYFYSYTDAGGLPTNQEVNTDAFPCGLWEAASAPV